jgi:hypothetical protein
MAYNKPIEIKITSQNTKGTEVNAIRLLDTIEKQLKTVLKEGDLFKSPRASVDYNTHAVTKSFFVRSEAENLARDIINLQKDNFYKEPSITSNQARMRSYKVDIEGEKALAALRADTAALGGRVYGNQHGKYVEIPNYKGARKDALGRAEELTNKLRIKIADEEERQEKQKRKEVEKEERQKRKEVEKEERQKRKEVEKEERQKEAERKQRSVALIAGLSASVVLLKKLVSLVENITTSVIEQGQKSFETSMTAQRLNISPDLLRKIEYAGIAKGIGSAPVNAMLSLQDSFGSTLLAAKNINKLDSIMPLIGADVEQLILNGSVGTNPLGMKTMLMDRLLKAYQKGSDGLGGTVSKEASAASLTSLARSTLGDDFATEFSRAAMDDAKDYSAWLTAAMPVSTPSYNTIQASSENYTQYNEASTGLKAVMEELKMTLSVVFDPLTRAIQILTDWVRRLLRDNEGIAESNRQNYKKAQASYERDKTEKAKFDTVINDYLELNKGKFGGEEATKTAMATFLDRYKIPEHLEGDEEGIEEFFTAALAYSVSRQFEKNLKKSGEAIEDYKSNAAYETGDKTLTFFDTVPSQTMSASQREFNAASWQYTASRIKDVKPYSVEEAEEAYRALSENADKYLAHLELIAEQEAIIREEEARPAILRCLDYGLFSPNKEINKAKKKIEKLEKANKVYEDTITLHRAGVKTPTYTEDEQGLNDFLGGLDNYISPEDAKEFGAKALKNLIERLYVGDLQEGESYKFLREENQTGKLTIQIIDKEGKERERIEVPAHLASPFNESTSYFMQGD